MKKLTLNAVTLRIILFIGLILVIGAGVAIFILGQKELSLVAVTTSELATNAARSNSEQKNLEQTKNDLEKQTEAIRRAAMIVSESKSYKYQDQIISDLNILAGKAGLGIQGITFTGTSAGTAAPATSAPAPAPAATPAPASAAPAASASKTTTATVTLQNPVDYDRVMSFVYLVEQNVTKMRIMKLNMSSASGQGEAGKGQVTTDSLEIEVYLR